MSARAERDLARLADESSEIARLGEQRRRVSKRRRERMLRLNESREATLAELAAAAGVHVSKVSDQIKKAREERDASG